MSPSTVISGPSIDQDPVMNLSRRGTGDDMESSDSFSLPGADEPVDLEELEQFACAFKQKRIKLGFTQGDVGLALGRLYGIDFSQTTISRFEALNLSFKNMCKLKPLLQKWLSDTELALAKGTFSSQILKNQMAPSTQVMSVKRRKKRTSIEGNLRTVLEEVFRQNPRPPSEILDELAKTLDMKREVIRVWFCNRRQKERRSHPDKAESLERAISTILSAPTQQRNSASPGTASSTGLLLYAQNPYMVSLF